MRTRTLTAWHLGTGHLLALLLLIAAPAHAQTLAWGAERYFQYNIENVVVTPPVGVAGSYSVKVILVWAIMGILKAGAAFFILDPTHPMQRLAEYFDAVRPKGLMTLAGAHAIVSGGENLGFGRKLEWCIELPPLKVARDDGWLSHTRRMIPA